MMSNTMVSLNNVGLTLNQTAIFSDFSLHFQPQGLSLLIGANGSGKTQLLRIIHRLAVLQRGQLTAPPIYYQAFLQQSPTLLNRSVLANLQFVKHARQFDSTWFDQQFDHVVDSFGLAKLLNKSAGELSGGQQKRVAMARLFLLPASLYLFDEPTANVDYHTGLLLETAIGELCQQNKKVIVTTHDVVQMERLLENNHKNHVGNEIILLADGQLISQSEQLDRDLLKRHL